MYDIELRTNAVSISNFDRCVIKQSVYQLANSAAFYIFRKEIDDLKAVKAALKVGDDVKVLISNKVALCGFAAAVDKGYYQGKPSLVIKVNSPASGLLDASVPGLCLKAVEAAEIVRRVVEPFGVEFNNLSKKKAVLPYFAISAADKADEVLQKIARLSDTLIYSDESGALVMADRCTDRFAGSVLATGENVVDIHTFNNVYKNFGKTVLAAQLPFDDDTSLDAAVNTVFAAKTTGENNRRYFDFTDIATNERLNAKAAELFNESYDLEVTGTSFFDVSGDLYRLNSAIRIKDEWLELDDGYRIVELLLDEGEKTTTTTLKLEVME